MQIKLCIKSIETALKYTKPEVQKDVKKASNMDPKITTLLPICF